MKKRRVKKSIFAVLLALMMALLTACSTYDNFKNAFFGDGGSMETVKIAFMLPETGKDASYGVEEKKGVELAKQLYGTVLGKDIELIYLDTQSSVESIESTLNTALSYEPAMVLGPYGEANCLLASQLLENTKQGAIAISNKNTLITENGTHYLRMTYVDSKLGGNLALYALNNLAMRNVMILTQEDDDTNQELIKSFTKVIDKRSQKLLKKKHSKNIPNYTKAFYSLDQDNFEEIIQELKIIKTDTVFAPVPLQVADEFFTEIEENNLTGINFLGTESWAEEDFLAMLAKHPGVKAYVPTDYSETNTQTELGKTFLKLYNNKYGEGEPSVEAALAFDAYVLAVQIIEKARSANPEQVWIALKQTEEFDGATGHIKFNQKGDPTKTYNMNRVIKGELQPLK
ncbi:MAG: ABC transporter substrate-binding protein [Clostridia bacterium]|nr:ABC transporter substrate-binding protein [Clostridia bacterium]